MAVRLFVVPVLLALIVVNYGYAVPFTQSKSELNNTENRSLEDILLTNSILSALETSAPGAIEGDILLPNDINGRKVISYNSRLWPAGEDGIVTVPYTFDDDVINQLQVEQAIKIWTDNTCIHFKEVPTDFDGYHLIFKTSTSCSSYVGMYGASGQEVNLHPSCLEIIYKAVHEIGHAMGFYHEQSRSDRDNYVRIVTGNLQSGKEGNFDRESTNNNGIPYDFTSVMHYGSRYFSANGGPTIVSLDPLMLPLIGNRESFSFLDIKLANVVYNCIDRWQEECGDRASPCLNDGYVGSTCECVCPDGTSGDQCENLDLEYNEAMLQKKSPLTEKIFTTGTISSPGYPTSQQDKTYFMKMLVAPADHKIKLVINELDIYRRREGKCDVDFLAIYTSLLMDEQTTGCGRELNNGAEFLSESDTLLVEFSSYDYASIGIPNPYRGFQATVFHVPIDNTDLLVEDQSGGCSMITTDSRGKYFFQSPNYPEKYGSYNGCSFKVSTEVPSYLKIRALDFEIGRSDFVEAKFDLRDYRTYGLRQGNQVLLVPTSHVTLEFGSGLFSSGKFNLQIESLTSNCHKIIKLQAGDTGELTMPSTYEPNTICEWWLVAPENMKIHLKTEENSHISFNSFGFLCSDDYLVVNKRGNRRYGSSNVMLCGSFGPKSIMSEDNELSVLFNGINGGSNNFEGRYSVIQSS